MRALVTGHRGFLGRHFYETLNRYGFSVLGLDVLDPDYPADALEFFRTDRDGNEFDLVVHCAAYEPNRSAIDNSPLMLAARNTELDSALFAWAQRVQPARVLYFSSSAVYPTMYQTGNPPYRMSENLVSVAQARALQPDGSYGHTKLFGERLADWYRSGGGRVTVVRPFSGYGSDQSGKFPFGAFRDRAIGREDPFIIWGDGTQTRDWIHVDDLVAAALRMVQAGVDGPVNLCTGIGTSMLDMAKLFCQVAGYRPEFEFRQSAPSGVRWRVGDPAEMLRHYVPAISPREGIWRATHDNRR